MPEQNGVAERKNRSVVEAARAMLEEKSLPKFYWAEVVSTQAIFRNKAELATLEGIREHSICVCTEREMEEAGDKGREMYLGRLLGRAEGL